MNNNDNRRVKVTKKMLKETLVEMLEETRIQKISIRELCQRADVNRSTFYKHYGSQYDLLQEMENDFLNLINSELAADSYENTSENSIEKIIEFLFENIKMCKILINEQADADFQQKLLGLPVILERCETDLSASGFAETDLAYAKKFFLFGGYNIIVHWINTGCKESPKEMADIITGIFHRLLK